MASSCPSLASSARSSSSSSSSSSSGTHQESSGFSALPVDRRAQELCCHLKRPDRADVVRSCDSRGPPDLKTCACRKGLKLNKAVLNGSCSCKGRRIVVSTRKAVCRFAGAFTADCAALCCCPCAIFPLIAWILVEIPSAIASRMVTRMKRISPGGKQSASLQDNGRDNSQSSFGFMRPNLELYKEGDVQAVDIVRFDTENLLKHFDAEFVGFGCLSRKRE